MKNKMKNSTKDMKDTYNKSRRGCSCEAEERDNTSNCGTGRKTK